MSPVPETYSEYPNYRHAVDMDLLASGIGAFSARKFLDQFVSWTDDELLVTPAVEAHASRDAKLYKAIFHALEKGRQNQTWASEIRSATKKFPGCGRYALRMLDKRMRYQARLLADAAWDRFQERKCPSIDHIGDFVAGTKDDVFHIR